ncbi:MAG: polysaccharide pyruvyl transferase family protein [Gammaproteobacteria bacterium]|nr:polysaccharide pyruvyl transferase family protein [Gammaproteobacteria bacterium]MBU2479446.1 polysaccharide pyruvyl transferase family protein [Gammaproteobacteria bacterium]
MLSDTHKLRNVLILAGDADGNLGDAAIARATCDALRRYNPNVIIHAVSSATELDHRSIADVIIPKGIQGLPALIRSARISDLVLCGGGGLFQDDDSLIKMPYWAARLLFVRLFSRRIAGYSIGAGPLQAKTSRFAGRIALSCLDPISVRDHRAHETLQPLTTKTVHVIPDPALLLAPGSNEQAKSLLEMNGVPMDGRPLIGVALRQWFHKGRTWIPYQYAYKLGLNKTRGQKQCDQMIDLVAKALDKLSAQTGAFFVFLPTYNVAHENDADICQRTIGQMHSGNAALIHINDPRLYQAVLSHMQLMLTARMHPAILAAGVGVPAIGLAYNQKFRGFFSLIGREDAVIPLDHFVAANDVDALVLRMSQTLQSRNDLTSTVGDLRNRLNQFNEALFSRT